MIEVPIKLPSNIYAYEEKSNKRDNHLLSQTILPSASVYRLKAVRLWRTANHHSKAAIDFKALFF